MNEFCGSLFRAKSGFLKLGAELACGGEGAIYEVANRSDVVAKLYLKAIDREKQEKLAALISLGNENLRAFAAWPTEGLWETSGKNLRGFIMPRIVDHKDIHNLYNPRSRKVEFPKADWRFLLHASTNVARVFANIHDSGVVLGDVNERGFMVSSDAKVRVIDCDSFQISVDNHNFLCAVGVPTFTPPELQNQKNFRSIIRTVNHDNFGLAVLIFHLLFMGKHPFAGRFLGQGEMSLEKSIAEFRFVYGKESKFQQMEPPPGAPPLAIVPLSIATLFEKAFSRSGFNQGRPMAKEWVEALKTLESHIKKCNVNASHYYFSILTECPWCKMEATTGVILFNVYVLSGNSGVEFNMDLVWNQIKSIPSPGMAPNITSICSSDSIKPSEEAISINHTKLVQTTLRRVILTLTVILCFAIPLLTILWIINGIVLIGIVGGDRMKRGEIQEFFRKHKDAEARFLSLEKYWDREAGDWKFLEKMRELDNLRDQWKDIPAVRQRHLQRLKDECERLQLDRFLDRYTIANASIPGIGASRKAVLESYNIESAKDIKYSMLVPGFGPVLKGELLAWRSSIEQQFRFDTSCGVDSQDIANLDRKISEQRRKLEQSLSSGASTLLQIKNQILAQRKVLEEQITKSYRAMLQAKADMDIVR
ncbi:MAG: hypothetical protein FWF87_04800 [Synergistaceae bacterium]|nr:hypothetical protein [Synergistaceae bacterium]